MPFASVAIDERTRAKGSEAQRAEWDASLRELLDAVRARGDFEARLQVSVTEKHFLIEAFSPGGELAATTTIPHELFAPHITEYVDIVRQIADAEGVNQMEALDMAKKVTHDRVARVLKRELRDFGFDHESSRKLFTLLLSLRVDTTKLAGVYGHRPMR